jgi:hypothetical protein
MSATLSQQGVILQPCTTPVHVRVADGTIVPAIQVGTYQVNPNTGASELVLNSLKYTDAAGRPIVGVQALADAPMHSALPPTRYWFSSPTGAPIYTDDGLFYTADGSPYSGSTVGYTTGGPQSTAICCPQTQRAQVWARFGNTYVPLTRTETTTYDAANNPTTVVSYQFEGSPLSVTAPIVESLPPAEYIKVGQSLITESSSVTPTNFPISGFSAVWQIPLPTVEHPEPSRVVVGGSEWAIADRFDLNAHSELATVVPPVVESFGNAVVDMVFRQRVSPLLAVGDEGLALLTGSPAAVAVENFDAPASVESTYEM